MRTDGCGAHGINPDGPNPRVDDCDGCQRWDWFPMPSRYQELLARRICRWNYCGHRDWDPNDASKDWDGAYELDKAEWRYAGSLLRDLIHENLVLVPAPPCECGLPLGDDVHDNIVASTDPGWTPDRQHPYRPSAEPRWPSR